MLSEYIYIVSSEYHKVKIQPKAVHNLKSVPIKSATHADCVKLRQINKGYYNMTLEDIILEENMNKKAVCKAVLSVVKRAQAEKRLTCGLLPAIKILETHPESVLFCIMPQSTHGDATLHIQTVLLQAFCYENDIHIIQVDCAEKLGVLVTDKFDGPRLDSSCIVVHQPWATDQPPLSKWEKQLVGFCHSTLDEYPQPVIKLPAL